MLPIVAVVAVAKIVVSGVGAEDIELNPLFCTLTFLLGYVLLLIRDLDDPFSYASEGYPGSAEVSLDPLERLAGRLPQPVD